MAKLEDFKTCREVAKATGIKYKTILQRIARGSIEYEQVGSMKLIPNAEYDRLMKEAKGSC